MSEPLTMDPENIHPWFALMVKSRHEKSVAALLEGKGYSGFLPLYTSRHRHAGKLRPVDLPLFPTYTFCRFDPAVRLPILTTPGVFSIVGFGNVPTPVCAAEIEAIQAIVRSGAGVLPWPYLKSGDRVRIETGSLRGIEGILVRDESRDRVVVNVNLLQRAVAVQLDRDCVTPLSPRLPLPGIRDYQPTDPLRLHR